MHVSSSAKEAADHAHSIVVLTEWDEFKGVHFDCGMSGAVLIGDELCRIRLQSHLSEHA